MGRFNSLKKNNNGSTLIMLVICIAFVSILGSLLLSVTVTNLQMKTIDHKSKSNFYNAETALDEIRAGIGQETSVALETAYKSVMEQFITDKFNALSNSEKEALFAKTFVNALSSSLIKGIGTYNMDKILGFVTNNQVMLITSMGENQLVPGTDNKYVTLKNIKISYTDKEDYNTTISTDIVINTPTMLFQTGSSTLPIFSNYVLIADSSINLDAATDVEAKGNVYAGSGGMNLNNGSSLTIDNVNKVVIRGDITVGERSKLNINGNSKLWAMNIATLKGSDTGLSTEINIDSNCYVGDDLMLNAMNSKVKINGEYYGYSYAAGKATGSNVSNNPSFSSAIIINGKNSIMDMSASNYLFLSGRAYLDPNSGGNVWSDNTGMTAQPQETVQTGESLAIKGNQIAYFVPREYIWCEKNPVVSSLYDKRPAKEVDFSKASRTGININEYADGYTKIFYQATGSTKLVYYFLKFKSEEKANEYLQKYYEKNNPSTSTGIIDNRINDYADSIKLNKSMRSLLSAGNLFTFDGDTNKSTLIPNTVKTDNTDASYGAMVQIKDTLINQYDAISTTLNENSNTKAFDVASLFNTFIDKDQIKTDGLNDSQIKKGKRIVLGDYVVTIVDNALDSPYELKTTTSLPNGGLKGIVIATGSVNVKNNYEGLIISGDTITLGSGVKVTASSALIERILKLDNDSVNKYIRNLVTSDKPVDTGANISQIEISDLINYDNWEKNEY